MNTQPQRHSAVSAGRNASLRRIAYLVIGILLALLCVFPEPFVARAKLLPQDSSSAGLGQILNSLGGQLSSFANLLTGGRPPNDLYLVIGRSDRVTSDVVNALGLARPGDEYGSVRAAKVALHKASEVHLLVGGVVEVEVQSFDAGKAERIAQAYVTAISKNVGELGRQTIVSKRAIVAQRFREASERVRSTEAAVDDFRRRNRLPSPEAQLGSALSLRTDLQARLQAKLVELQILSQNAGPDNPSLRNAQAEVASLRATIARTTTPSETAAGPNLGGLSGLSSQYQNLYRDARFAQALYDVYTRASEQVAVEELVAERATYIQIVEPVHLDAERHYNVWAIGLLAALALLAVFTEIYAPATGLRWPAGMDPDHDG